MDNNIDNEERKNDKGSNKGRIILVLLIVVVFCITIPICIKTCSRTPEPPNTTVETKTTATVPKGENQVVENPIDFAKLKEGNREIFSWIRVEDTKVDYPICQSNGNDEFYLRHKAEDRSWSSSGAIYIEMCNSKGFNDPVTLIYGHNGYGDSMFTTLHYFEKKEFFDSHPYFYIYTTNRRLTYQVVSAFKYDNRHIMNSFDFADEKVFADFCKMIQNPESTLKNVRTELDTAINNDSKIVVLSTCITNQKSNRYLVCGVLVKDEKTN